MLRSMGSRDRFGALRLNSRSKVFNRSVLVAAAIKKNG